jgi:hypothetical protein
MTKNNYLNVLIVPGTTEIAREMLESLKFARDFRVFGAGVDLALGNTWSYEKYFFLESFDYLKHLEVICLENNIDYILPAHDDHIFDLKIETVIGGAKVIRHPSKTIEICRSKLSTYNFLSSYTFTQSYFTKLEDVPDSKIFLKPAIGQGSKGTRVFENKSMFKNFYHSRSLNEVNFFSHYVVSNYLPGLEYTIDCFSELGSLKFARARERVSITNGIAVNTIDRNIPELTQMASEINDELIFDGPWFFQVKADSEEVFRLLEIGCRIAGSSSLRRAQNVNLTLIDVYSKMGKNIVIDFRLDIRELGKSTKSSFQLLQSFQKIYIDFDDTILLTSGLDFEMVGILFSLKVAGIPIILITRHRGDLNELLLRFKINDLFAEVIHIKDRDLSKESFIDTSDYVLFVDDSFMERYSCSTSINTTVLEPSIFKSCWLTILDNRRK